VVSDIAQKTWSCKCITIRFARSAKAERVAKRDPSLGTGWRGKMIARVRIAPVERWDKCHAGTKTAPHRHRLSGLEVEIETDSMTVRSDCHDAPTKFWRLTTESARKFDEVQGYFGRNYENYYIRVCEHMLEMD
jgi:hypothetical protein